MELRTEGVASSVDPGYDRIGRLTSLAHTFAGGRGNLTLGFTRYNPASQFDERHARLVGRASTALSLQQTGWLAFHQITGTIAIGSSGVVGRVLVAK